MPHPGGVGLGRERPDADDQQAVEDFLEGVRLEYERLVARCGGSHGKDVPRLMDDGRVVRETDKVCMSRAWIKPPSENGVAEGEAVRSASMAYLAQEVGCKGPRMAAHSRKADGASPVEDSDSTPSVLGIDEDDDSSDLEVRPGARRNSKKHITLISDSSNRSRRQMRRSGSTTSRTSKFQEWRRTVHSAKSNVPGKRDGGGGHVSAERLSESKVVTERFNKLREIFKKLDLNADGRISIEEIHNLLVNSGASRANVNDLRHSVRVLKTTIQHDNGDHADDCDEDAHCLDFEEFAEIVLQSADDLQQFPEGVAADLQIIRNLVIREDAKDTLENFLAQAAGPLQRARSSRFLQGKLRYDRLDTLMAVVIVINTVTLGWGTDDDSDLVRHLETFFNALYLLELFVKMKALGILEFFFGSEWSWHWFDATLCMFAAVDLLIQVFVMAQGQLNSSLLAMLRLVRLARLQRIVKLLRYRIFSELTLMVKGVSSGLRTLLWAVVLLFFVVYVFSLILRQLLKDDIEDCIAEAETCNVEMNTGMGKHLLPRQTHQLFGSVPNAMFTIFRCVSGDCATPKGTPVAMVMADIYGALFMIPYCSAFLFVTFGIFNLIVATFVETVMEAARLKRRMAQDQESLQVGKKLERIIAKFLHVDDDGEAIQSTSCWKTALQSLKRLLSIDRRKQGEFSNYGAEFAQRISRSMFVEVVQDEEVRLLLDDLDIGAGDRMALFDVIDADGSGELDVRELVVGLLKLRGGADKSDVVASLLGVRALQRKLKEYMGDISDSFQGLMRRQSLIIDQLGLSDDFCDRVEDSEAASGSSQSPRSW
eukprot:TRINITY_DN6111_c1_g1_i1.p1 TRINITY_DN6111_c1_g1~~TRINITY_DN6111_c1_g1_i1.p1  ORF type:complete len:823 (+),score=174.37 TRINITY_DN6111_c1_g1_i1:66-2534(+)